MAVRDRMPPGAVLDVHYADLMSDPMAEVERIYGFIGMELEPDVEGAMQNWMRQNPRHKNGPHRYRLSDFGIDRVDLDARFKRYRERFGVAREDT